MRLNMILESNGNFQKFELDMSCSSFSRQLKISEIKIRTTELQSRESGQFKQREIAIRNFRHLNITRVELSYLAIGDKEHRNSVGPE